MKVASKSYVVRWVKDTRKFIVVKKAPEEGETSLTREMAIQKAKLLNAKERKISAKLKKAAVDPKDMVL